MAREADPAEKLKHWRHKKNLALGLGDVEVESTMKRKWEKRQIQQRWKMHKSRCSTRPQNQTCLGDYYFPLDDQDEHKVDDACALLRNKGIRHLTFCGDSYMRQLYIGFLSLVSGNYKNASLDPEYMDRKCDYDAQYSSKACRKGIETRKSVCGGRVEVSLVSYMGDDAIDGMPWCIPWEGNNAAVFDTSNAVVWFGGNHPANGDYAMHRDHDASAVHEYVLQRFCSRWCQEQVSKIIWVGSHAALDSLAHDHPFVLRYGRERVRVKNTQVEEYNKGIRAALQRVCNISRFVDVFPMTHSAVQEVPNIQDYTYDGRHWGAPINILKAKLLLFEIAKARDGEFASTIRASPLSGCAALAPDHCCLRILSPSPGSILDHRTQVMYFLEFTIRINCTPHIDPAPSLSSQRVRQLIATWAGRSTAWSLWSLTNTETLLPEPDADSHLAAWYSQENLPPGTVRVGLSGLSRYDDDRLTWTLIREDGSEELATILFDYHPWPSSHLAAAPYECICSQSEQDACSHCHVVRW